VGTETVNIVNSAAELLIDLNRYNQMANAINPFGDGHAAERILATIKNYFID
jgi:UDP-N-acetylglucosamine 2-epimerase (non-hydrolysing)